MAKSRFERSTGTGPFAMVFLALVLYLFFSLAYGWVTKDDVHCSGGFDREWRIAPPGWVCR